jgi:hypothetical protein
VGIERPHACFNGSFEEVVDAVIFKSLFSWMKALGM